MKVPHNQLLFAMSLKLNAGPNFSSFVPLVVRDDLGKDVPVWKFGRMNWVQAGVFLASAFVVPKAGAPHTVSHGWLENLKTKTVSDGSLLLTKYETVRTYVESLQKRHAIIDLPTKEKKLIAGISKLDSSFFPSYSRVTPLHRKLRLIEKTGVILL